MSTPAPLWTGLSFDEFALLREYLDVNQRRLQMFGELLQRYDRSGDARIFDDLRAFIDQASTDARESAALFDRLAPLGRVWPVSHVH